MSVFAQIDSHSKALVIASLKAHFGGGKLRGDAVISPVSDMQYGYIFLREKVLTATHSVWSVMVVENGDTDVAVDEFYVHLA